MTPRVRNKVQVALHLVWTTTERLPLIRPEWEREIYRCVAAQVVKCNGRVLAIGGMPDHLHLLAMPPTTISIADLAKQVKGATSSFVRDTLAADSHFGWSEGYGVFSVSPQDLKRVVAYIENQKAHHAKGTLWPCVEEPREVVAVDVPRAETPSA
jgi:putative transposase